jgi:hypothetical protein
MGWYSVKRALESGDENDLSEALSNEIDPARSLQVAKNEIAKIKKDIRFGDRVRLLSGPWVGHEGVYIEDRDGLKPRRVVRLDNEEEAFVTGNDQWERVA